MIKDFRLVFKNTNFIYLWASQLLSQLTINTMNFLLLLKLFETTQSSVATSMLWVAYGLPAIFVGPIGAAAVDFFDKRKILIVTNLFQALAIFIFALFHESRNFLPYGIVFIYSFLNQFYVPAEASSVPLLVNKKALPQANSLFFLTLQGAIIFGFGFAGVLSKLLGFEETLFLCAGLVFLAFISVTFLPQMQSRKILLGEIEENIVKFAYSIAEGYRFIKGNRNVLVSFLLLGGMQITLTTLAVNAPSLAVQIFKINPELLGIFIIVPAAIGAILGAFMVSRLLKNEWRKKRVINLALFLIILSVFSLIFVVPSSSLILKSIISALTVIVLGFSFVSVIIPTQTFLQEKTPKEIRGRVFGNYNFILTSLTIFPVLFSGTIVEIFGVQILLFLLGGLALSVLLYSKKSELQI
jgi:predicted MFS family arabinose efflux permease